MDSDLPTADAALDFPWIYVCPYLQLRDPLELGDGVSVVPADAAAGDPLQPEAIAVLDMYERPSGAPNSTVGAFVCAPTLGPELDDLTFKRIALVLAFTALDANPIPKDGRYSQNAGLGAWTTENALLRGHKVTGDGSFVWAHRGVRARTSLTAELGKASDVVPLAPAVDVPIMGRWPDTAVASATWSLLTREETIARRVGRAIEWLSVAWENSETGVDMRLQALHAGFDALFGSDDAISSSYQARDALCDLLDPDGEPRFPGALLFPHGKPKGVKLSERGYWFHHFTQLRNGIAHGDAISPDAYGFDGYPHFNRAEYELRRAILATIAHETNQPHLAIADPFERALTAAGTAALEQLLEHEPDRPNG